MKTQERNKYKYLSLTSRSRKLKKDWNGIPAFIKPYEMSHSLIKHFLKSFGIHIAIITLLCVLFSTFKIDLMHPIKNKNEMRDIEFVMKSSHKKRGAKLGTQFPSVSPPSPTPQIEPQQAQQEAPKNIFAPKSKTKATKGYTKVSSEPVPDLFSIPVGKIKPMSSAGGATSRHAASGGSGNSGSSRLYSPEEGYENGSPNGSASGKGNGGGFDKTAVKKTISSYDISPYVNELKRNIRMNWKAPALSQNKNVELFLRIAKDGRVVILNVKRTSEVAEMDEAALNAVRKSQPFNPLPQKYPKGFLDVIFTFSSGSTAVGSRF